MNILQGLRRCEVTQAYHLQNSSNSRPILGKIIDTSKNPWQDNMAGQYFLLMLTISLPAILEVSIFPSRIGPPHSSKRI